MIGVMSYLVYLAFLLSGTLMLYERQFFENVLIKCFKNYHFCIYFALNKQICYVMLFKTTRSGNMGRFFNKSYFHLTMLWKVHMTQQNALCVTEPFSKSF